MTRGILAKGKNSGELRTRDVGESGGKHVHARLFSSFSRRWTLH